jgi:hypothetical protein
MMLGGQPVGYEQILVTDELSTSVQRAECLFSGARRSVSW